MPRYHALPLCAGLLILSCLVQGVVVGRAVVTGLDAPRFAAMAQRIDRDGLLPTLRALKEQPLFAVEIWLTHRALARLWGEYPGIWAASAQAAAVIPLVLSVIPVYLLLLRLLGAGPALAGAVLYCILPEVARLGADGISDSTHLLFFAIAFWAMTAYWTGRGRGAMAGAWARETGDGGKRVVAEPVCPRQPAWLLLAGLAAGLAMLVRAEILVLLLALAVSLLAMQFQPARREARRAIVAAAALLAVGLAIVLVPYLLLSGLFAPRLAVGRILLRPAVELPPPPPIVPATDWLLPDGQVMSFMAEDPTASTRRRGWAIPVKFGRELLIVFWYWIGALAVVGVGWTRGRTPAPVDRFVRTFAVSYGLLALAFALKEGYISSRHLLPLVVVGIGCAGLGALVLGRLLIRKAIGVGRAAPDRPCDDDSAFRKRNFRAAVAGAMVVAIAAGACFWQTFKPLSPVGLGHRAAARWLAARPEPARTVVDTQGWMGLYSGWSTRGFAIGPAVFADPNLAYVVLERNEIQRSSSRSRTLRELLETAGQPVAVFPGPPSDKLSHDVLVYRWNAERLLRWATVRRTARPGAPARPSSNGPLSRVPGPPRAGRRPTGPGNLS